MVITSSPDTAKTVLYSKDTQFSEIQNISLSLQQCKKDFLIPLHLPQKKKHKIKQNQKKTPNQNKTKNPKKPCSTFPKEKRCPKKLSRQAKGK